MNKHITFLFSIAFLQSSLVGMGGIRFDLFEWVKKDQIYMVQNDTKAYFERLAFKNNFNQDYKRKDQDGNTILHLVARSQWAWKPVIDYAHHLHFFNDENIAFNVLNNAGETPLFVALKHDRVDKIERLAQDNAQNIKNKQGLTPLHYAILYQNKRAVEALFKPILTPELSIQDNLFEMTPLELIECMRDYILHTQDKQLLSIELLHKQNPKYKKLCAFLGTLVIKNEHLDEIEEILKKG